MRNEQRLSWPRVTTNALSCEDEKFGLLEAQEYPLIPKPARLKSRSRLCDSDLEDQKFDHSLRSQNSLSTLVSSCTTLCDRDAALMEDLSLLGPNLPLEDGSKCYRVLRWRIFTPYRQLFILVFLANFVAMVAVLSRMCALETPQQGLRLELGDVLTAASFNLTASILIRNEHVINMLFRLLVIQVTPKAPLRLRRVLAKVYHFGGIHTGGGTSAVVWYGIYTSVAMFDFVASEHAGFVIANIIITVTIWLLMCSLLVAAFPRIRARLHNCFERTHRYCGWAILALFWGQTLLALIKSNTDHGQGLFQVPTFYALVAMTLTVAYPWCRLKHVHVQCEVLSKHAIRMYVKDHRIMQPCRVVTISHYPLRETHKFATIPEPDGKTGFSMVISRAGDWTANIIDNPPEKIWIKGAPTWGVLRIATMFDPVVIVATGSGIGPCLGLFNGCPQLNCRVVWQARTPVRTYGSSVIDAVLKADKNAVIIDTQIGGRQDMTRLAYKVYQESKAEAVIVISNTEGTYNVVRGLESRGIPAYGPIWDS